MTDQLRAAAQAIIDSWDGGHFFTTGHADRIGNLRAALAEPGVEPVAWMCPDDPERETAFNWKAGHCENCGKQRIPLYTAPPQRKPLTDDEIVDIWAGVSTGYDDQINIIELARAIEAALKEKNNGVG